MSKQPKANLKDKSSEKNKTKTTEISPSNPGTRQNLTRSTKNRNFSKENLLNNNIQVVSSIEENDEFSKEEKDKKLREFNEKRKKRLKKEKIIEERDNNRRSETLLCMGRRERE